MAARTQRFSIIDKLGNNIEGTQSLTEALDAAGLNWTAKEAPVQYTIDDGTLKDSPFHRALYRSDNGDFLGIVGSKYQAVQNEDAFAMAEALMESGMTFVRGGLFGSQTSVTLRAEDSNIEGDIIKNYVTIRNSFDGSSKVQFAWIPVRQVCENGLCVEVSDMKRTYELPHIGDIGKKYQELFVKNAIGDGTEAIKRYAASLLKVKCGTAEMTKILDKFFPVNAEFDEMNRVSTRVHNANLLKRQEIAEAFGQDDLANFNGTAYKIFQAFCDFETHSAGVVSKKPEIAARQQFARAFEGYAITTQVMAYLKQITSAR